VPRPATHEITFTIDDREITAPENTMLVDAAKFGDVEIPVFCYEPKLGAPVGACRMCLVEIEGIPKLQTACSTAVKDGMVVHTQTDRVQQAQRAVVEFLLLNHPLDCPVCDKGGECPLQDISYGWGDGVSRMVEPKRHFEKPIALSPLIAIDRERCILCYRCVRFSQELSEDYQLVLRERGASTFVATFDSTPYVAPFSGNIVELCPVGALTSQAYRFRARPWDIEGAGSVCTLCPVQCNVSYTVRDDRILRVLARQNDEVDDGWLCDRGRFSYQAAYAPERITTPLVRDGGKLRPASWERALDEAAGALRRAGSRAGLIAGGGTSSDLGFLAQRIAREALGTADIDSRARDRSDRATTLALADPALQATISDIEYASTLLVIGGEPLDDAPGLDLRVRKGVRRHGVKLVLASARPSALDENAAHVLRLAPGDEPRIAALLASALKGGEAPDGVAAVAQMLRQGGDDVVILYGERVLADPAGGAALVAIAGALGLSHREGGGLIGIPAFANGRGLAEAGLLPFAAPGYFETGEGRDTTAIAEAAAGGDLAALWLLGVDPVTDLAGDSHWERGLEKVSSIVAHASFLTPGLEAHANVVFPAEYDGERDGVVCNLDGRLQRLRQGVGAPGDVRPGWWVISQLAARLGLDLGLVTGAQAMHELLGAVARYDGVCLDDIAGQGLVPSGPVPKAGPLSDFVPDPGPDPVGSRLRVGTFKTAWSGPEVAHAPALAFLHRDVSVELSPADAERLDVRPGAAVELRSDDGSEGTIDESQPALRATVVVRSRVPVGSAFVQSEQLDGPLVDIRPAPLIAEQAVEHAVASTTACSAEGGGVE